MATNYSAWMGLPAALGSGMDAYRGAREKAEAAKARAAQAQKQEQMDALSMRKTQAEIDKLTGAGAGGLNLSQAFAGTPGERLLNEATRGLPVDPDKLPGLLVNMAKEGNLSAAEGQSLGRAKYAGKSLQQMGESFQKLPKVEGAGEMAVAFGSRFMPSMLKQREMPEVAEFDANKRMLAERLLRIATGAAAPDPEKREYLFNIMPAYGDTPQIAAQKAKQIQDWLRGEAEAAVLSREAEGNMAAAQQVQSFLQGGLPSGEEVASYFMGQSQQQAPQGGFDPAAEADRIAQRRQRMGR